MLTYLAVGLGGAIGSCLRYGITTLSETHYPGFPFGTLISNVIAGILIGFILELNRDAGFLSKNTKLFLTTGTLGGLSTFSTFSAETVNLFKDGSYFLSFLNVGLNLGLSLLGVLAGTFLARSVVKGF